MDKEKAVERVVSLAREYHRAKHNCAESVFKAVLMSGLAENFPPEVSAIATGFGGGIGASGNNCGALIGAVMAAGMKFGRISTEKSINPSGIVELRSNPGIYRVFNQIPYYFKKEFGSTNCRDLVGEFDDFFSEERSRKCAGIVEKAARIAAEIILMGDDAYKCPLYENVAEKK